VQGTPAFANRRRYNYGESKGYGAARGAMSLKENVEYRIKNVEFRSKKTSILNIPCSTFIIHKQGDGVRQRILSE
jgi:hypothetical protein